MATLKPELERTRPRWYIVPFSLAWLICALMIPGVHAQEVSKEHQVKAAFLFNFTQFVNWPDTAFASHDAPFVIGVVANDTFAEFVAELVEGESVAAHPLKVVRYPSVEAVSHCHMLFISAMESAAVPQLLDQLSGKAVLTVSDADDFAAEGGMIQFRNEGGRIRLTINIYPVEEAGLVISSKMLRLSEIVQVKNE